MNIYGLKWEAKVFGGKVTRIQNYIMIGDDDPWIPRRKNSGKSLGPEMAAFWPEISTDFGNNPKSSLSQV